MRRTIGVAVMFLVTSALCAEPELRVAVIAGEGKDAPDPGVVELLEVELSKRAGVVLLERTETTRILAEHELTAKAPTTRAEAMSLGSIIPADVFLFIEGQASLRMQYVEARSGIVLGSFRRTKATILSLAAHISAEVEIAIAKARVAEKERRYISLLGISSEQLGTALEGTAEALGLMLRDDLERSAEVIVLDREHLNELVKERDLARSELKLQGSALVVEGAIRRDVEGDDLVATIVVNYIADERRASALTVHVPAGDIWEARRGILHAVLTELRLAAPSTTVSDIERQAIIRREAIIYSARPGRAAAEAAFALEPTYGRLQKLAMATEGTRTRMLLAQVYRERALQLRDQGKDISVPRVFHRALDGGGDTPVALSGQALPVRDDDGVRMRLIENWWNKVPYRNPTPTDVHVRLEKEIVRYKLACELAEGGDGADTAERVLRCIRGWSLDAGDWAAYLRELLTIHLDARKRQGKTGCDPMLLRHLAVWQPDWNPFIKEGTDDDIEPTLSWMRSQGDDLLALTSYVLKVNGRKHDSENARKAFEYIGRHLTATHPQLQTQAGRFFLQSSVQLCYPHLAAEEQGDCAVPFFDDLVEHGSFRVLLGWLSFQPNTARPPIWFQLLDGMPPGEALARLRKVESRVHDCRALTPETSLQNGAIDQLDQRIATRLAALGYAPLAANDAWWDDYRFDPIDFGPNPDKSAQLVVMKQQGERLWMVWLSRGGKLHVTHAPVRGGKQTTFGTAQITSQVNDIAVAEDRIYVATSGDGIVALDRKRFSVWNETSRLDANHVSALGYLGGKLYFWLTSESHGAMYRYDPGVDRIDTLFSTKTKAPRGLLDGPPAYHVESILADEQNACLWLGLSSAGSRNGLWRYDLRSGEAQCVGLSGRKVKHIERVGSRLLLGGGPSDTELFLFTPRDSMTCSLLSDAFSAPIFGAGYACAWPAVLLGGDLITSTRKGSGLAVASSSGAFNFQSVAGLYLHRRSGDRPARRKVLSAGSKPAIVHMLAINDHEAVAAESGGIFWRLSRIGKGPAASLPWVNHGQGRLADLVARHGRIIEVVAVSSSSQSPGFSPDSASDRDIHTCWAAAPGATTNEWLQFNFDKETTIDSILIVNGWVPDRKSALFYARNHRAARIRVQFAGDDARSYTLHDLNCPQVVHIDGAPRSRNVRVIFEEIYSTGLHNPDDPPWLNISEVLFFEQTGDQATSGGVRESHQNVATLKHQQGEE